MFPQLRFLRCLNAERSDPYRVGIDYSQLVANELVLVADVCRETARRIEDVTNMAEIDGRHIVTPQTIVSASVGFSFANSSEAYRAVVGFSIVSVSVSILLCAANMGP